MRVSAPFVIQYNQNPNHPSFLYNTYKFLVDRTSFPFVEREDAIVIHANTAVSEKPARKGNGAYTSCIFSPNAQFECNVCRPTVCMQPVRFRENDILDRCTDVLFREMGSCIHAFTTRVPRFVTSDSTDRSYPLLSAEVHGTINSDDPRLSGSAVAASVKWINDSLDNIVRISSTDLRDCPMKTKAEEIEPIVIADMRTSIPELAENWINWAVSDFTSGNKTRDKLASQNPDNWRLLETISLEHMVHSLTALGLPYNLKIAHSNFHGILNTDNGFIQVIAIRGETHEDCQLHFDEMFCITSPDPIVLVTRDRSNLKPTERELSKFIDAGRDTGISFIDYDTLITLCRDADDENSLKEKIDEYLPGARRII